ncbi:MAG: peptidase M28 [Candidatus Omnitrophota bacterium]|jgi:heat shock protein HtpX|nr:MAG: peptidase M28 [Candidatus Omnitrophota bacterium]
MWEAIRSNQRRSIVLIMLMGVMLVVLGFVIGMTVDPKAGGPFGALAALALWFFLCLIAFAQGDSILLLSSSAHKIEKEDAPQLWNVVEEMTIASGLGKMPSVYIIENDVPNAFATGRKPESATVAVTSGLLKHLNRDELQGVIAHEIGHIKNFDIRFMTLAAVLMGSIILLSDTFLRSLWYGGAGRRRSRSSREGGQEQIIILAVAILFAILAPIMAQMLYLACSRRREYLADASGALFTRYPEGLASALEKISHHTGSMKQVNRALAPLYIINPLQSVSFAGLFSTHPPTELRIKILRSMSGAGLAEYEAAYKKIHGEKKSCLGARTLAAAESVKAREAGVERDKKSESITRLQEVNDLLTRFGEFLFIPCACGVRIKVPSAFKRNSIACPRCGTTHSIPSAGDSANSNTPKTEERKPFRYVRKENGWESFKCSCGKVIQLSPRFSAPSIDCPQCRRTIEIVNQANR